MIIPISKPHSKVSSSQQNIASFVKVTIKILFDLLVYAYIHTYNKSRQYSANLMANGKGGRGGRDAQDYWVVK